MIEHVLTITPFFAPYDMWIGAYWDRFDRVLYICPLPMVGLKFSMKQTAQPPEPPCKGCGAPGTRTKSDRCRECGAGWIAGGKAP